MNSNFSDAKTHFIEHGYCNASLKDIDLDFYNYLEANFLCDEQTNLQNKFYRFRFDSKNLETKYISPTKSYEDARLKKEQCLNSQNPSEISQCWYGSHELDNNQKHRLRK